MVLGVVGEASFQERDSLFQRIDVPNADQITESKIIRVLDSYGPLG
jgi:hypothetical protein